MYIYIFISVCFFISIIYLSIISTHTQNLLRGLRLLRTVESKKPPDLLPTSWKLSKAMLKFNLSLKS